MRKKKQTDKFEFDSAFQQLILQLTVTDKVNGLKAIKLYEDFYFTLTHHAVIAWLLKGYFKKKKRIPSETILRENLRLFYTQNKLSQDVTEDDRVLIDRTIKIIYAKPIGESDDILESIKNFARYVKFKEALENVNINDYNSYSAQADKLKSAQNIGQEDEDDDGEFLVAGMKDRAHNRQDEQISFPTPFSQFNNLLNGGGLTRGSLIMYISQAKRFKTGSLVNTALGYLRRKKKVIYFDLENGQKAVRTRAEQSIIDEEQEMITSGKKDKKLLKLLRRYSRLKSELVIKRMPAYSTTNDFQAVLDRLYLKYGLKFDIAIVDYPDLMGSTNGEKDEVKRIDSAYIDLKNLGQYNDFEAIYVASHVTRDAAKRRKTKYEQNDLAKCIDKIRHCDCCIGLQENDEEMEAGVLRMEIVDQRNGMRNGKMLFWMDIAKQKLKEFNKKQIEDYYAQLGESPTINKPENSKAQKKSDL